MKPTEHEMTVAVDAAARHLHETAGRNAAALGFAHRDYDDLHALARLQLRENVLPLVVTALQALPDRAPAAAAAARAEVVWKVRQHMCTCHTTSGDHEQWCPAAGVDEFLDLVDQIAQAPAVDAAGDDAQGS